MTAYRLFPATNGPSAPAAYSGNFLCGVIFKVTQGGCFLNGFYHWVPPGGDTVARKFALWQITAAGVGSLVSSSVVTSGTLTTGQWNFVAPGTPVPLAIGSAYNACTGWVAVNGFPDSDTAGAGTGAGDSFGAGGHTAGITAGPLFAFSDQGQSAPEPYGSPQGVFSVGGSDASVIMPGGGSNSGNFWMDVQVTDATAGAYAGSYRLWPNKFDANANTVNDSAVNYTLATEFHLLQPCTLSKIWYFSPSGTAQLATRASIWRVSDQAEIAVSASPSWSGAAGSGWVSTSFTGVTLPVDVYKVSVYNGAGTPDGWGAKDAGSDYWRNGAGAAGIVWGPLLAPNLSSAGLAYNYAAGSPGSTPPFTDGTQLNGQSTFEQGPPNRYPALVAPVATPTAGSTQNYWVDVEVNLAPVAQQPPFAYQMRSTG